MMRGRTELSVEIQRGNLIPKVFADGKFFTFFYSSPPFEAPNLLFSFYFPSFDFWKKM
jgi:hypothetical protein